MRYSNPNGPSEHQTDSKTTETQKQEIEHWPEFNFISSQSDALSFNNDSQRAYLILNSSSNKVDYNLKAEYCGFWGSLVPSLKEGSEF